MKELILIYFDGVGAIKAIANNRLFVWLVPAPICQAFEALMCMYEATDGQRNVQL